MTAAAAPARVVAGVSKMETRDRAGRHQKGSLSHESDSSIQSAVSLPAGAGILGIASPKHNVRAAAAAAAAKAAADAWDGGQWWQEGDGGLVRGITAHVKTLLQSSLAPVPS